MATIFIVAGTIMAKRLEIKVRGIYAELVLSGRKKSKKTNTYKTNGSLNYRFYIVTDSQVDM